MGESWMYYNDPIEITNDLNYLETDFNYTGFSL